MTLRDNLAAVLDRIKEAIAAIDAAEAAPEPAPEAADPTGDPTESNGGEALTPEPVSDPPAEPVRDGGPASV